MGVIGSIKGNKTRAIFSYCRIRDFIDITAILQESVMLFVNDIAKVVHGVTSEYLGFPNKNVGNAFLIVWKIPETELDEKFRIKNK